MRIATWNVERLAHKKNLEQMLSACNAAKADILVLTETDERMRPEYKYCFSTLFLKGISDPAVYAETENRVSIYTNYECVGRHKTYDENTAICVEIETEIGNLLVYGTIIGLSGNRRPSYAEDLLNQMKDIKYLVNAGYAVCMIGDFNCTFSDNYYYTKFGRESMLRCFADSRITILTEKAAECIDHIAVSDRFLSGWQVISIEEWNQDKRLSDHKGIVVEIR